MYNFVDNQHFSRRVEGAERGTGAMIVSPYLKRRLRTFEEAQAEAERLQLDHAPEAREEPRRVAPAERDEREAARG